MASPKDFCRLCLNIITEPTFITIENVVNDILEFVQLKLNLCDKGNRVMCSMCYEKLFAVFEFKSTCVDKDDTIMTYVDSKEELPLDIIEIYRKEMNIKGLNVTLDNTKVCRLCLQLITDEFVSVQDVNVDLIRSCIPEMNVGVTRDPMVCKECFDALHIHAAFLNNCFTVQSKIKNEVFDKDIEYVPVPPPSDLSVKNEDVEMKQGHDEREMDVPFGEGQINCKQESVSCFTDLKDDGIPNSFESSTCPENLDCTDTPTYITNDLQGIVKSKSTTLGVHKCQECDYQTKYKHHLTKHALRHKDLSEIKMYKCGECEFQTKYMYGLASHQLIHRDISEVKMHKCAECDFQTKYKRDLKCHELRHRDVSEVEIFECKECDYQTRYKYYLERHLLRHKDISEIQMHKCKECDYQTRHKNTLANHRLQHRDVSEVKMHKCNVCDFQTKYSYGLVKHQWKHKDASEVRMYKCTDCDYQTTGKYHLDRHQLIHKNMSDVKIYECKQCNLQTKHRQSFIRHQVIHRDVSEIKMHKCEECDFQTKYRRSLLDHLKKHKDESQINMYKCKECHFQSKYQRSLALHRKKHKGVPKVKMEVKVEVTDVS